MATAPSGFVALAELVAAGAFAGTTENARELRAQRWVRGEVSEAYRAKIDGGRWCVSRSARLPGTLGTVETFLRVGRGPDRLNGFVLPSGHESWSEKQRQRFLDSHKLLDLWDTLRAKWSRLSQERVVNLFAEQHGEWCRQHGLSCDLQAIWRYRRRLDPGSPVFDGNVDGRGRKPATDDDRAAICSPEAWQLFEALYLQMNQLSAAEVDRLVRAQVNQYGWKWPAQRTVQRWAARLPRPVKVMAREGIHKYEAKCLPKTPRDYEAILAGRHWDSDERTLDVIVRVPDSRKGWRLIRPLVTAIIDKRSRKIIGWHLGERANWETLLAAADMAIADVGIPDEWTMDNGPAEKVVSGKRRFRWSPEDERQWMTFCDQIGVQAHRAVKKNPWSKQIESIFRVMKEGFDKHQATYCGGRPEEKPADLAARLGDVSAVPTLESLREDFAAYLESYHATPQSGDGMFNLSPNLVMERFRGPIRTCDPEVRKHLCSRLIGPRTVGRDGVRYDGILYGRFNEALYSLQGQRVWLRINPGDASYITVCDERGVPITRAENSRLKSATPEDVRKAAEHRGRLKKATKEALKGREFLFDSTPGQIMALKREAAQAAEAELRKALPPVERKPDVVIVRPDLHEAVKTLEKQEQRAAVRRLAQGAAATSADPDRLPTPGEMFARIYEENQAATEATPAAQPAGFNWADFYEERLGERTKDGSASGYEDPADCHGVASAG